MKLRNYAQSQIGTTTTINTTTTNNNTAEFCSGIRMPRGKGIFISKSTAYNSKPSRSNYNFLSTIFH